jgi:PIN domain nuclease of toxin-antitoxin system
MRFLLDSHILVWMAAMTARLPRQARDLLEDPENTLFFSAVSIWELTVKHAIDKDGIPMHPSVLYRSLIDNGITEVPITSLHGLAVGALPMIHKDPFDRLLLAQCRQEGMTLLTADRVLASYDAPIRLVR